MMQLVYGYMHLLKGEQFEAASHEESQASLTRSIEHLAGAVNGTGTRVVFFLEDELKHSTMDLDRELSVRGFEAHRFQHLPKFETAPEPWADRTHWSGLRADAVMRQIVRALRAALPYEGAR